MPELLQTGSNLDDEDGDGGDPEEEEELDNDEREGNCSTATQNMFSDGNEARQSLGSSFEGSSLRPPYPTSLYRSQSGSSSSSGLSDQEVYFTPLPGPDTSRIDLSFIDNVLPPPMDRKGKAKARWDDANVEASENNPVVPTLISPYGDYFGSLAGHRVKEAGRTEVLSHKDSLGSSLLRTPRPDDAVSHRLQPSAVGPSSSERSGDLLLTRQTSTRPIMYKHASKSLINFHTIETKQRVEQMIREEDEATAGEANRQSTKGKQQQFAVDVHGSPLTKKEGAVSTLVDRVDGVPMNDSGSKRMSRAPTYESLGQTLRRRRSMPTFTEASDPPPYPSFSRSAGFGLPPEIRIQPRDDEGRERLPEYSNGIYMQAVIPRKMEFVATAVQAKDRKWRKVLCVLEGTVLKIYRPTGATGVSAIGEWWERKVGVGDATDSYGARTVNGEDGDGGAGEKTKQDHRDDEQGQTGSALNLSIRTPWTSQLEDPTVGRPSTPSRFGFRLLIPSPRRTHARSVSDAQASTPPRAQTPRPSLNIPASSGSPSTSSSRARTPEPSIASGPIRVSTVRLKGSAAHTSCELRSRDLLRTYSMQNAESGLGNDYIKRKNVIRVRVDGEQFLLQAKDTADVVAWIEVSGRVVFIMIRSLCAVG